MLDKLDKLARGVSPVEGVCIRLLPYRPVFWSGQKDKLEKYLKESGETWRGAHNVFILTCPLMTSLTVEGEVPLWAQSLNVWWEARSGEIIQDWLNFEMVASEDLPGVLWEAYQATRNEADLPRAPAALQQPAPLPVDDNGKMTRPMKAGGRK